jgi:GTPase SAR1 family protein
MKYKIVLYGNNNTGKTSFLKYITFNETRIEPTKFYDITLVEHQMNTFVFWDTSGLECFREQLIPIKKDANKVLLFISLSTFNEMSKNLENWLNIINFQNNGNNNLVQIVITHNKYFLLNEDWSSIQQLVSIYSLQLFIVNINKQIDSLDLFKNVSEYIVRENEYKEEINLHEDNEIKNCCIIL